MNLKTQIVKGKLGFFLTINGRFIRVGTDDTPIISISPQFKNVAPVGATEFASTTAIRNYVRERWPLLRSAVNHNVHVSFHGRLIPIGGMIPYEVFQVKTWGNVLPRYISPDLYEASLMRKEMYRRSLQPQCSHCV